MRFALVVLLLCPLVSVVALGIALAAPGEGRAT